MIKSLRKNFIIVAMCSTFVVLAAIMGIINWANYNRMLESADGMTSLLAQNGGVFKERFFENIGKKGELKIGNDSGEKPPDDIQPKPDGMSPETPFETRFFTVTLDEDGEVIASDLGKIAAISQETAEEYAENVFFENNEKGFCDIYRYRVTETEDEVMIIFLDCRQNLENIKNFGITSVAVSAIGLLTVFVLVLIFSKIVFKPVEESYEKQKRFITDASHEIKTPLTIIDANTEVIEMESGENQWTKSTRNQVKRLSYLTYQLITLSKLDEQGSASVKREFSLSQLIEKNVEIYEAIANTQNKTIRIDIEENINFVGDEKAIAQLIGILLDNAIKYSINNGEIRISLKQKGKKASIVVSNPTEEIAKGNLDILFERFYRTDSSRNSETGGSGIGLSVAKSIVNAHKGKITAFSEDGKSLRITIELR